MYDYIKAFDYWSSGILYITYCICMISSRHLITEAVVFHIFTIVFCAISSRHLITEAVVNYILTIVFVRFHQGIGLLKQWYIIYLQLFLRDFIKAFDYWSSGILYITNCICRISSRHLITKAVVYYILPYIIYIHQHWCCEMLIMLNV